MKKPCIKLFIAAALLLSAVSGAQEIDALGTQLLDEFFAEHDFTLVQRLDALPSDTLEVLSNSNGKIGIAERGEPFNSSDRIRPNLPSRRHDVSGVSDGLVVIVTSNGGYTPSETIQIVERSSGNQLFCDVRGDFPAEWNGANHSREILVFGRRLAPRCWTLSKQQLDLRRSLKEDAAHR